MGYRGDGAVLAGALSRPKSLAFGWGKQFGGAGELRGFARAKHQRPHPSPTFSYTHGRFGSRFIERPSRLRHPGCRGNVGASSDNARRECRGVVLQSDLYLPRSRSLGQTCGEEIIPGASARVFLTTAPPAEKKFGYENLVADSVRLADIRIDFRR